MWTKQYGMFQLPTLDEDVAMGCANGINDLGQVVGYSYIRTVDPYPHAVIWTVK
jgi:probable HAF family extracellular repeat protein